MRSVVQIPGLMGKEEGRGKVRDVREGRWADVDSFQLCEVPHRGIILVASSFSAAKNLTYSNRLYGRISTLINAQDRQKQ